MSVTSAEAVASIECPLCGARRLEPCVYVVRLRHPDSWVEPRTEYAKQLARAGTPTRRAHGARCSAVTERRRDAAMKDARQRALDEQVKLRAWLIEYGEILFVHPGQRGPSGGVGVEQEA